ncbi:MAG TPA: EscS/YscS/HrcS family type III secretion system export apparatus protein [Thiothrix sp.]|nr:EscS/YscS/HrcS family type III secretion system export apparatus protein [Thiothrix sp.]
MDHNYLTHQTSLALQLILQLSLPVLAVATIIGLIVSLLQALTSIQEQTLPHVFKLVGIIITISVVARALGPELYEFANNMFTIPFMPKP